MGENIGRPIFQPEPTNLHSTQDSQQRRGGFTGVPAIQTPGVGESSGFSDLKYVTLNGKRLLVPTGSPRERLISTVKHRKEVIDGVKSQLGMDLLRMDPAERQRSNVYIFAHLPDSELRKIFPPELLNYTVYFAAVFRPTGCIFLPVSRLQFVPDYHDGNLRLVNGMTQKAHLEAIHEIDQLVAQNTQPIDHPVYHLNLLRGILKSCDTHVKDLKRNPAPMLSGGTLTQPNERDYNMERWNNYKHTALAMYLQYAEEVEERFGLGETYYWEPSVKYGDTHKDLTFKEVYINDQFILMNILGFPTVKLATVKIRKNQPDKGRSDTSLNISALKQKIEQADSRRDNTVSEEERWLAENFG